MAFYDRLNSVIDYLETHLDSEIDYTELARLSDQEYCIANMQFEREEYFYIKQQVTQWILDEHVKIDS